MVLNAKEKCPKRLARKKAKYKEAKENVAKPDDLAGLEYTSLRSQFRSANYYDWTKEISEISSKFMKYIATIFEHNFYTYFFRKCYEEVDLKKVIIIFLNLATYAFSTSVFHIMCKRSYGFHFIGSLYKMNKYKRIKKYFHFTSRSNSYKKLKFARNFIFVIWKENKGSETVKRCISTSQFANCELNS